MVTIRETQQIANDTNRHVWAKHPHGLAPKYVWLSTTSANIKPGMPVKRGTGAGGEATATETATATDLGFGIAEWDEKQIATCGTAYASGDLIPVIPFDGNDGLICRNIVLLDPNAAVPADTWLVLGASGFDDVLTAGTSNVHSPMANQYHIADPGANTTIVARIQNKVYRPALT